MDIQSGEVVGFLRQGEPAQEVLVDASVAESTALSYAQERYAGFEDMGLEAAQAELIDNSSESPKFYAFWWIQRDPNSGAYLPNEVKVRINAATGDVDSYESLRVEVVVPTEPAVSQEEAATIALSSIGELPGAQVLTTVLAVSTVPVGELQGEQALLWQVVVAGTEDDTGYIPGASVFLDAQTGEIVHISLFQ